MSDNNIITASKSFTNNVKVLCGNDDNSDFVYTNLFYIEMIKGEIIGDDCDKYINSIIIKRINDNLDVYQIIEIGEVKYKFGGNEYDVKLKHMKTGNIIETYIDEYDKIQVLKPIIKINF